MSLVVAGDYHRSEARAPLLREIEVAMPKTFSIT
jgi:hypothetical protein